MTKSLWGGGGQLDEDGDQCEEPASGEEWGYSERGSDVKVGGRPLWRGKPGEGGRVTPTGQRYDGGGPLCGAQLDEDGDGGHSEEISQLRVEHSEGDNQVWVRRLLSGRIV